MIPETLKWMEETKQALQKPTGNLIEIGSFNVNGSVRSVFESDASSYIGVDIEEGPGVDMVLNGELLADHFKESSFDTVICCDCLEHCLRPWLIVEAMKRVLKPGGLLWISAPTFGFPEHRYPIDCYRFGEDAYRGWLFADMQLFAISKLFDSVGYPVLVAVGLKP